jgi:oligosaccharide translocation protein RFT1
LRKRVEPSFPSLLQIRKVNGLQAYVDAQNISESLTVLCTVTKFYIFFGSFFVFFGSNYTGLLLKLLYAKIGVDQAHLLSWYCLYVPFLGVNGITEAFLQGVGDSQTLSKQAFYMVFFWLGYMGSVYIFLGKLQWGSVGLIVCNIINMCFRIIFSTTFIVSFFQKESKEGFSISSLLPLKPSLWFGFIVSFAVTRWSQSLGDISHLAIGCVLFIVTLLLIYKLEKDDFIFNLNHWLIV